MGIRNSTTPTKTFINIKLNGASIGSNVDLEMYDAADKLISKSHLQINDPSFNINVSRYAAGIYTFRMKNEADISVVKFVKE